MPSTRGVRAVARSRRRFADPAQQLLLGPAQRLSLPRWIEPGAPAGGRRGARPATVSATCRRRRSCRRSRAGPTGPSRGQDLATGPDRRLHRFLALALDPCLLLGLLPALAVGGLLRLAQLASLAFHLAPLLGRRHRVEPGVGRRRDLLAHRVLRHRRAGGLEAGGDQLVGALRVNGRSVIRRRGLSAT